jgi:hypothetical protein
VGRTYEGCTEIYSDSKPWPCLFPEHGPVASTPGQSIHSDGCRCINRVTSETKSGIKRYEYPRYMFKNESGHIRGIFIRACELLAIDWRWDGLTQISIARRERGARLDSFVGPKS